MKIKQRPMLALVSSIVMATTLMASSMVAIMTYDGGRGPITQAEAYSASTLEFSGDEKAQEIDDFAGAYRDQNKYKMYCVLRSLGCTKEQACGALGSSAAESGFCCEIVEGHFYGSMGTYGTVECRDAYIEAYSSKVSDADERTKLTDDVMRNYGVAESYISRKRNGDVIGYSVPCNLDFNLNIDFYYTDGVGWLGCGIYQFTGTNLGKLLDWCESLGFVTEDGALEWWNPDAQISFLLASAENGGYGADIAAYIARCEAAGATTAEECNLLWNPVIGFTNSGMDSARASAAGEAFGQFVGDGWDEEYANEILAYSALEAVASSGGGSGGIEDRGIVQNYASVSIKYPQSCGFIIDNKSNEDLKENNNKVFKEWVNALAGNSPAAIEPYSLFELFGEDLNWYRYFGEATYTPQLLDHIWSAVDQDKTDYLLKHPIDTIFFDATNYLSCQTYPGRPQVLTTGDLDNGDFDPRVLAISNGWFNGYPYVLGSFMMTVSKYFVSIVSFLAGDTLLDLIVDIMEYIEDSDPWATISAGLMMFVGFAMIMFIISLVKKGIRYSKGSGSMKEAVSRFLVGFICLGLIFAGIANPKILNTSIRLTAGAVDGIFEAALADQLSEQELEAEIIAVKDEDKAIHAILWKTAIFGPWCRGQFSGREYHELYTQYASVPNGGSMMPQDKDEIDLDAAKDVAFYNSAALTGDVGVPVGGGKVVKNWAAYLYSCGSKYHIDSTIDANKAKLIANSVNASGEVYFPHTSLLTTANNPDIVADVFRVVDAQMNISPQYFSDGSEVYNYRHANSLDPEFAKEGFNMLVNAALLLFLVPPIFKKLMSFILLMATIIKMIYGTILELFKEDSGLSEFTRLFKKHFFDYFISCLKICVMVTLYGMFVDKGFFKMIIYCALCLVILGFNFKEARKLKSDISHKIRRIKSHGLK